MIARQGHVLPQPGRAAAILAVLAAVWLVYEHREGWAFAATTVTMASSIVAIFVGLYPNVMVSSTNAAYNLTVHNTASGCVLAEGDDRRRVILLPVVLVYQAWTYYVFRRRVSAPGVPAARAAGSGAARGTRTGDATRP